VVSGRVLINETLARRFFPNQDPIGRHLVLGVMDAVQSKLEIVGVVGDVRKFGLDRETEPTFYSLGAGPTMTLVVKAASLDPSTLRAAIQSVDPDIPVGDVHPLQQNLDESLSKRRLALSLLSIFGAIAAFLTAAGIYALMAQSVAARLREFGVRAHVYYHCTFYKGKCPEPYTARRSWRSNLASSSATSASRRDRLSDAGVA
jgi:hypothetical protein